MSSLQLKGGNGKLQMDIETEGYKFQAAVIEALKEIPSLDDAKENANTKPGTQGKIINTRFSANYLAPHNRSKG